MNRISRLLNDLKLRPTWFEIRAVNAKRLDLDSYTNLRSAGVDHQLAIEVLERVDTPSYYLRARYEFGRSHENCMKIASFGFRCLDDYVACLGSGCSHSEIVGACEAGLQDLAIFAIDVTNGMEPEEALRIQQGWKDRPARARHSPMPKSA